MTARRIYLSALKKVKETIARVVNLPLRQIRARDDIRLDYGADPFSMTDLFIKLENRFGRALPEEYYVNAHQRGKSISPRELTLHLLAP